MAKAKQANAGHPVRRGQCRDSVRRVLQAVRNNLLIGVTEDGIGFWYVKDPDKMALLFREFEVVP